MRLRNFIACLLLALPLLAFGQAITGTIRGTVTDSSGAVVPNATVSVVNTETKLTRTVQTDGSGEFSAPLLAIGHYDVVIEVSGFSKYQKTGLVLNANDRLTVDTQLKTGSTSETVNVEANPVQVNLQNASVEGLIDGTQIRQLPLNNRNYEQLVTLQPGVTSNAADQIYVGTTNPSGQVNIVSFSINGNRQSQNNWTIDGADNVDHGSNITLLVYPSVDAIAEFKVERSNYNPEFGRSASGQINVATRSGTSNFHGSLYEFFRNDALNANSSFNNHKGLAKPVLRYNDFGGTIGGPLYIPGVYNTSKQKTFFFFSEEARRVTTPVTQTSTVPTIAQRNGQFTNTVCTAVSAAGTCTATGNTITNFDAVYAAYLKDVLSKIPAPNGGPSSPNALVTSFPGVFNYREELIRVDHVINSKVTVMGRYLQDSIPTQEPFGLFGPQSTVPGVATTSTNSPGRQFMTKGTVQFSSSLLNEVGYAYSYGAIESQPIGSLARTNSPNVVSAIKLPYATTLNRIPNILFDDDFSNLAGFGEYLDYNRNHEIFDNLSWVHGKHNLKFGFTFNHYQKRENAAGDNVGNYGFDSTNVPGGTNAPQAVKNEQDWANFMLGFISSDFLQAPLDTTADVRQNMWEFYGQDEWRVRPNLTLSFGLRYSLFRTPYSGSGTGVTPLTSFDPAVWDKSKAPQLTAAGALVANTGNLQNGLIIGGQNSPYGEYITSQDNTNFAPRLGIAWDPFGTGKTSVRAGYGVFYDSVAAGLIEDNVFNNPPFLGSSDFTGGFFTSNIAAQAGVASKNPPSIWTTAPKWHTPYSQQWSLSIQQEIGRGWIGEVGYVGNKGTHLVGVQDINQVFPGVAQAAGLVTPGQVYGAGTSNAAAARALNPYRPYVGWGQIGQIAPQFDSNYNALQTSLSKRFSGNASVVVNYTWSRGLTDNQTDRSTGLLNTYCRVCDYGRSQLDRTHVFTTSYVYDTPWFSKQEGFVGHLLGGYQLSGIVTINSGLPLTVIGNRAWGDPAASGMNIGGAPNNGAVASPRPNQVGDPNSGGGKTWTNWFNASAFVAPTTDSLGSIERRGAVDGPGLWRVDFSMMKNVKMTERTNLQFRAEAFNLFNHTNFSTVGTSVTTSTYNTITGTRDPRILQLAAKFTF
jgi:hypothetical protein